METWDTNIELLILTLVGLVLGRTFMSAYYRDEKPKSIEWWPISCALSGYLFSFVANGLYLSVKSVIGFWVGALVGSLYLKVIREIEREALDEKESSIDVSKPVSLFDPKTGTHDVDEINGLNSGIEEAARASTRATRQGSKTDTLVQKNEDILHIA